MNRMQLAEHADNIVASPEEREQLAKRTGLTERQVRIVSEYVHVCVSETRTRKHTLLSLSVLLSLSLSLPYFSLFACC
jgi:hypothetical protein